MVAVSRMSLKKNVTQNDNVLTVIGFAAGDNASKLCKYPYYLDLKGWRQLIQ